MPQGRKASRKRHKEPANPWHKLDHPRSNFYPDRRFDGRAVAVRISLNNAKPGVRYKYVVDEDGAIWVTDMSERTCKHNSLLPAGANAYSAGWLIMHNDGVVDLNCSSGHYMAEDPLLGSDVAVWRRAMAWSITRCGKIAGRLFPTQDPLLEGGGPNG